jgi:hypothetical protein
MFTATVVIKVYTVYEYARRTHPIRGDIVVRFINLVHNRLNCIVQVTLAYIV